VPLAALMVALTATTLWSLGQTIIKEPEEGAASPAAVASVASGSRAPGP
jgi:hypothetical protein